MADAVFEGGVPAKITIADFRRYFLASFPRLADETTDGLIEAAIDTVYAMFTGVAPIWDMQPEEVWYEKTVTCYRLLTAWYIGDMYPMYVAGIPTMGGMLLKRRKIDGVDLTFADGSGAAGVKKDYQDLLEDLKSNPWGSKARTMLKACGKRALIRNRPVV